MTETLPINAKVTTPNGPGLLVGRMLENEQHLLLVRHNLPVPGLAGTNQTPQATKSGLWSYPISEVKG